ncbi:MAG: alanine--tRNA ligase [Candidatus Micrarchaeaceae archaeon]
MTDETENLNKDKLREDFSNNYKNYYSTKTFDEEGFIRKKCKLCGKYFWTLDENRDLCGDPEHEPYSFIRNNTEDVNYVDFWKKFADFFRKNDHEEINKYPVVSRWRQDLYFTIASIQDFQRIENGSMNFEYPANPLIVPQICLRFNDIENTGITGRHFTSFMMAGQHAFNYPKEGYWRDETIRLNFQLLTNLLKINKKNITYIEDVWAMGDFSEFGPCLESFSNGLELVNNVFTQFGIEEGKIKELKGKVVDVGWGFERLIWFYSGKPTAYDAVFNKELDYLYKHTGIKRDMNLYSKIANISGYLDITSKFSKKYDTELISKSGIEKSAYYEIVKPMQASYAIIDHLRTLLFAISDGALPSNVGGGYNLRILLRRIFALEERYGINIDLIKIIELLTADMSGLYDELHESIDEVQRVFDIERKRYNANKTAAASIINEMLKKHEPFTDQRLRIMYESNGISPYYIAEQAKALGEHIDIPENFYVSMIKDDFSEHIAKHNYKSLMNVSNLPKTNKLYYTLSFYSKSKVLKIESNMVVLDQTPFYPEGGGQEADHGTINGIEVKDVQITDGIIIHFLSTMPNFKEGDEVNCLVDTERRARLIAHHTATHLISAAAREILGKHAWQEGAKKGYEKAHIDIAHYEKLSEKEINEIENKANSYILNGISITAAEMSRKKAEQEFGFSIYQGHGVPVEKPRIVEIRDLHGNLIDAEACGGLHAINSASILGLIKITNSYRIHDGIDRIEFVAGYAALDYIKKISQELKDITNIMKTDPSKLKEEVQQQIDILKSLSKNYIKALEDLGKNLILNEPIKQMNYERQDLRNIANGYIASHHGAILLYNNKGDVICLSNNKDQSALEFIKENIKKIKQGGQFVGGGSERIAEGKLI